MLIFDPPPQLLILPTSTSLAHVTSPSHLIMSTNETSECKPFACAIQDCLLANGYDESKCSKAIDALYKCCKGFYETNGPSAQSVCCPKFNLLQKKLERRKLGPIDAKLLETRRG